jgi:ABC-2 type transport system permease protein
MRIFDLALKDLQQVSRDKMSLIMLVLMPIVFTFFMGFALSGNKSTPDSRLAVGWINQDNGSLLSAQLETQLTNSGALRLVKMDAAQANGQLTSGKITAALVVPAGFSAQTLAGQASQLTLWVDASTTNGQTAQQVIQAALVHTLSMAQTAQLAAGALHTAQPNLDAAALLAEKQATLQQASQAWQKPVVSVIVEKAQAAVQPQDGSANPYTQTSPGIMVQFTIFGMMTSASVLVMERKTGSLQRLLTTSINRAGIIAGHVLAMFSIVFLQEALLIVFGQLFLGVNYLRQPLATLLVMIGLGLWITCLGLLVGVVAKAQEQVIVFSLIAMFVLTALGGCWFPLEITGPTFSRIGYLTPAAWAMKGFQDIILRGQGLAEVLAPVGIMLAYAAGFFVIAIWLFRRRLAAS